MGIEFYVEVYGRGNLEALEAFLENPPAEAAKWIEQGDWKLEDGGGVYLKSLDSLLNLDTEKLARTLAPFFQEAVFVAWNDAEREPEGYLLKNGRVEALTWGFTDHEGRFYPEGNPFKKPDYEPDPGEAVEWRDLEGPELPGEW